MSALDLIQCDCLVELPHYKGKVDLLFVDPPYNQGIDYGLGSLADYKTRADYEYWCDDWISECVATLKPTGCMWIMCPHEWQAYIYDTMLCYNMMWRNTIIWHETFGVNCTKKFSRTSRMIHYFVADPKNFTFNADAVRVPSDRQLKYNDPRANPLGKVPGDVWTIPRVCGTFRERRDGPTQVPLELMERIILATSNPGDLVLDPMCGTGTTLLSANRHGRRAVGFEISPEQFAILQKTLYVTTHP